MNCPKCGKPCDTILKGAGECCQFISEDNGRASFDPFSLPDYKAAIYRALKPDLRDKAYAIADQQKALSRNHDRKGLRLSDAGRCRLETWADIHDAFDLPEDLNGLLRMNAGSLTGCEIAALLKVGVEFLHPTLYVEFEADVAYDGIPGHVDCTVRFVSNHMAIETVEVKTTFASFLQTAPYDHWLIQSGAYGKAQQTPTHSVVCYQPALQAKGGVRADFIQTWRFSVAETEKAVAEDYTRLRAAEGDKPPAGDAKERFRCQSCRYSACFKNPHNQGHLLPPREITL